MSPKIAKPKERGESFRMLVHALAHLERRHGKHSMMWAYHDADGKKVGVVVRWDRPSGKDIRPVACYPDGWQIGAMPEPRPLYGLPDLANAATIIVCEGEKAADAARRLGFIATTSSGGSAAASKTDWSPLGGKEVLILPDNDAPGRKYAETVARTLTEFGATVRVVELPNLPEGGDIVEWIKAHGEGTEPEAMRAEIEALAQEIEPWRPDAVEGLEALAYRPFPVDALPEPTRSFVDSGAEAIGCDVAYLALPLLVAAAAAIGNTRRLELKGIWSVPPILWGAIVGESGSAKSPAFKLVMQPVRRRQEKALKLHAEAMKQSQIEESCQKKKISAGKQRKGSGGPLAKLEPRQAERFLVSDTTVEALAPILTKNPRGLLLARDELAGWFGSFDRYAGRGSSSSDSANWLSMFSAEQIIVDRKTGIPRTFYVKNAAVCVCGGIQPGILRKVLSAEHRESGLAARLLLAFPPRKPKTWTEADIDPDKEAELERLFDNLYDLQPAINEEGDMLPILVRLSPDAKDAWIAYYNAHNIEQAELADEMAAAWSKLEEYAARTALVLHLLRWAADPDSTNPDMVDAQSMKAGIALTEWFKHEARRVYAMLHESAEDADRRRLIDWIARKGAPVTAREVQQGCRWLRDTAGAAEEALESLAKSGGGHWIKSEEGRRGHPTRRFKLTTPSTVYGNGTEPETDMNP
jgi:5S rRNA maturation endonuclease (ribonuclease M5)